MLIKLGRGLEDLFFGLSGTLEVWILGIVQ